MIQPGSTVAGYRIDRVLGHGGMGMVYEATQLSLERKVALKILAPQFGEDVSFRARFRREGQIQAAIDHPNIVPIYEAGEVDDGLFIAMRMVKGGTLKNLIVARELEGARTLRLLKPVADALSTAHGAGLIHRDIKPQNILVDVGDRVFLADFGLTKGPQDTGLTRTGQFVGTLDYVSPEQIRGEPGSAASDIYALGAVLYECLTGIVPYARPSDAAVLYAHMADPPPLVTDERPELPDGLDEVISKAMAKEPSERHEKATLLIEDAERAFGKKVRAVITPPDPVESPEQTGLREVESKIPTRESRVRRFPPEGDTAQAPAAAPTAAGVTEAGVTEAGATEARSEAPPAETTQADAPSEVAPAESTQAGPPSEVIPAQPSVAPEPPADPTRPGAPTAPAAPDRGDTPVTEPAEETVAPASSAAHSIAAPVGAETRVRPDAGETAATTPADQPTRADSAATGATIPLASPAATREHPGQATAAAPAAPGAGIPARTVVLGAAGLLLLLALIGFFVGRSGSTKSEPAPLSRVASSRTVSLRTPTSWRPTSTAPAIPGLTFSKPVALSASNPSGAGITAGLVAADGPTLLPAKFRKTLPKPPTTDDQVKLGKLAAYRYANLRPSGSTEQLTLFVVPTTTGVATVACRAPPASASSFQSDCNRVAETLGLVSGRAYPLGPSADYAAVVDRAMKKLNTARASALKRLRAATKSSAQANAASDIADAYKAARSSLAGLKLSPADRPANAAIVAAAGDARAAWTRLESAARAESQGRYSAAKSAVKTSERSLRSAMAELKDLGYSVTQPK